MTDPQESTKSTEEAKKNNATETNKGNDLKTRKAKVLEQQQHVTEKISDLCRYIGFGIAAACYAIFTSTSDFSVELVAENQAALLFCAGFAVFTILLDYLQFLSGYISVRYALKDSKYQYNKKKITYKLRFIFFYIKQVTVSVTVIILLYTLYEALSI